MGFLKHSVATVAAVSCLGALVLLHLNLRSGDEKSTPSMQRIVLETPDGQKGTDNTWLEALDLPIDVWARGPRPSSTAKQVVELLGNETVNQLKQLCGRCLYHTLFHSIQAHSTAHDWVFVTTGDIPDMWIRDSAVQIGVYLPRISKRRGLRQVIEGAIRTQAFFILQDPYANSYSSTWRLAPTLTQFERHIGRGGWVATRNFELDSGAYFMHLLWNYMHTPGLHMPRKMLSEPIIHDAVAEMLDVWALERYHEEKSIYRYSELPREGKGALSNYTGMVWCGYRPSDDKTTYGFNIAGNMYTAGALVRVLRLNNHIWKSKHIATVAQDLLDTIRAGIEKYGIVKVDGVEVYAYEADGLGNVLTDFDDPNVPSLLAMPFLGYPWWNQTLYENTRARMFSKANSFYYEGTALKGLGSPHTPSGYIWPLATVLEAMTTTNVTAKVQVFRDLLTMQCGNGLMHESVNVNGVTACTRPIFEWANAMLVTGVESELGIDCDDEAEAVRLEEVIKREQGVGQSLFYETLLSNVAFVND